jgi:hypothetical protein
MPALLLFGDTERSPALRHEVPLAIIDSLMFCERYGRRFVLARHTERSRIARALRYAEILDFLDAVGIRLPWGETRRTGGASDAAP